MACIEVIIVQVHDHTAKILYNFIKPLSYPTLHGAVLSVCIHVFLGELLCGAVSYLLEILCAPCCSQM